MSKSLSTKESSGKGSSGSSRSNPQSGASNAERNSAVQAMNAAQKNPPTAKLPFNSVPMHTVIPLPGAVAHTKLTVGGELTAKKVGSTNPATVSPSGASASYSGKNGSVNADSDGSVEAELKSTLNGIKYGTQVKLDGGKATVGFGVAGDFGTQKISTDGSKIIYKGETPEIKKVVNGVEISGKLSFTVELTIVPNPPQKQPQSLWDRFTNTLSSATQALGDFVYQNREAILIGTAVVAVGAVIVMTGGAAAPALAVGSDRRLKRNIKLVGRSPSGIPQYTFQYLDHDTTYHGVMAQDLETLAPEALVKREDGMFAVYYDLIDVDFYSLSQ